MPPSTTSSEEITFRAEYKPLFWPSIALLGLTATGLLVALLLGVARSEEAFWKVLLGCGFCFWLTGLNLLRSIRELQFGQEMTFRRYVGADIRIPYGDVLDVSLARIVTRQGRFSWEAMSNGDQLAELFDALIEKRVIPEEQLTGQELSNDIAAVHASVIAGAGLLLLALLMWVGVIPWTWFSWLPDWAPGPVLPLAATGLVYLIVRYGWFRKSAT